LSLLKNPVKASSSAWMVDHRVESHAARLPFSDYRSPCRHPPDLSCALESSPRWLPTLARNRGQQCLSLQGLCLKRPATTCLLEPMTRIVSPVRHHTANIATSQFRGFADLRKQLMGRCCLACIENTMTHSKHTSSSALFRIGHF
jgi:hypothetical protein